MVTEVWDEWIDPDAFNRLVTMMLGIELAAALCVTEVLPVGCFVAGTCKSRLFDKGFQENRTVSVAGLPVVGQAATDKAENAGGKIVAADPWQDEEACIVDDEVEVALSLRWIPSNGRIAGLGFPGARAEAHQGNDVAGGADEVAQLRARH